MPTLDVPITGRVLGWAREEAGLSRRDLATAVGVEPGILDAWEMGIAKPSRGLFTKLVRVLRRPSSVFFLPEPPKQAALPTSFRTARGLNGHVLSKDEVRQVRWARTVQAITAWTLRDQAARPVELPRFTPADSTEAGADRVRHILQISVAQQMAWGDVGEAFRAWRGALENQLVLVFQLQLGRDGIRGFSAWDDHAPIVAVNTAYDPTARIFTLFHEVGHLVTRTDSACPRFVFPDEQPIGGVERWCERFAAALLLPGDAFRAAARREDVTPATGVHDIRTVRRIAKRFKVSTRAARITRADLSRYLRLTIGQVEDLRALVSGGV